MAWNGNILIQAPWLEILASVSRLNGFNNVTQTRSSSACSLQRRLSVNSIWSEPDKINRVFSLSRKRHPERGGQLQWRDVWRDCFRLCPLHLSPLAEMFEVRPTPTDVSAASLLRARSRKWVMNNHGLCGGKPKDWHLVLKTFHCWVSNTDSRHWTPVEYLSWYLLQDFPPWREATAWPLSNDLRERGRRKKKSQALLQQHLFVCPGGSGGGGGGRILQIKKGRFPSLFFPLSQLFLCVCAAWRFTSRLKLIFSPRRSIGCNRGST